MVIFYAEAKITLITAEILYTCAFIMLCAVMETIVLLMAVALFKMVKIVRAMDQENKKLNVCFIIAQITSFIACLGVEICEGTLFIIAVVRGNVEEYQSFQA